MSGIFAGRMDRTVWKGGWREIGGYKKYYRSRWEANYARWLERERLEGRIHSWAHEPKTFWFEGVKRGVNNYLPDFQVVYQRKEIDKESGEEKLIIEEEYHEVKGWMDSKSATKIKRMTKYHPTVKLIVIDRKIYTKLEKECATVIEGWELLKKDETDDEKTGTEEVEKTVEKETKKEKKPRGGPSKKVLKKLEKELE